MTDTNDSLRRQIAGAADLQAVVRTMRAIAASSIAQYERAVEALAIYREAVDQGLGACFREAPSPREPRRASSPASAGPFGAIVFGSDQGLVGPFNEVVVASLRRALDEVPGMHRVWAVGDRVRSRLEDAGIAVAGAYAVPNTVEGIAPLVDRLLIDTEKHRHRLESPRIEVFHNRPVEGGRYEQARQLLLPLDASWRAGLLARPWPAACVPEILGDRDEAARAMIREHLFIVLFQAAAESLASENASRLAAMQRADRNIDDLLASLRSRFYVERQSSIDEELFDVVAGYGALLKSGVP